MENYPYIKYLILDQSSNNLDCFSILSVNDSDKHLLIHKSEAGKEFCHRFSSLSDLLKSFKEMFPNISNYSPKILAFDKQYPPEFNALICAMFITDHPNIEEEAKLYWLES